MQARPKRGTCSGFVKIVERKRSPGPAVIAVAYIPTMTVTTDVTPVDLGPFLAGLPKCELHVHLEGTLSPDLKLALAQRNSSAAQSSR